mmetsp:Transcript_63003/g.179038  ORF Transcript_63003/g.179038 Transcript_63003/m.179038 type:complete len:278 (-) Transcript_63003:440-1273(-)
MAFGLFVLVERHVRFCQEEEGPRLVLGRAAGVIDKSPKVELALCVSVLPVEDVPQVVERPLRRGLDLEALLVEADRLVQVVALAVAVCSPLQSISAVGVQLQHMLEAPARLIQASLLAPAARDAQQRLRALRLLAQGLLELLASLCEPALGHEQLSVGDAPRGGRDVELREAPVALLLPVRVLLLLADREELLPRLRVVGILSDHALQHLLRVPPLADAAVCGSHLHVDVSRLLHARAALQRQAVVVQGLGAPRGPLRGVELREVQAALIVPGAYIK